MTKKLVTMICQGTHDATTSESHKVQFKSVIVLSPLRLIAIVRDHCPVTVTSHRQVVLLGIFSLKFFLFD